MGKRGRSIGLGRAVLPVAAGEAKRFLHYPPSSPSWSGHLAAPNRTIIILVVCFRSTFSPARARFLS